MQWTPDKQVCPAFDGHLFPWECCGLHAGAGAGVELVDIMRASYRVSCVGLESSGLASRLLGFLGSLWYILWVFACFSWACHNWKPPLSPKGIGLSSRI